jgi:two-component system, OmpR family, phosphate regulon sensor histidine kinase PhoR
VVVAGLSSLVAGLFLDRATGRRVTEQIAARLAQESRLARDLAAAEPDLAVRGDALADRLGRDLGLRVTLIARDGRVIGDTDLDAAGLARVENHGRRPEIRAALRDGEGRSIRFSHTVGERMLYVAARIDPVDPERGVVRLAVPLTAVREAQEAVRPPLFAAALLAVAAAAGLGFLAARDPARRLQAMARTASEIAAGRMGTRARPHGDDEIDRLARSLDRMADQLEERLSLLARERRQLRTVLDGMVEGVLLTDVTGRIALANGAFLRIFGARAPVEGLRPLEAARVPALQEAVEAALAAAVPVSREIALEGETEKVILASLASVREAGEPAGAVAVFHDVTELKQLERVRREFVANVSHELRTPLTAIRGYAETLRDGGLRDHARAAEFVEVIHRNAGRLRDLIEDLLDLSAVEQGQARLSLGPVAVGAAVTQAEAVIRPALDRKGQSLVVELPEALPPARADRDRLAQVLINLLDNAVKFTPEGGVITITAAAPPGRVVLEVRDTGVGIPPDEIGRVFERFYRVDRSRDRREGGTGLGLAIAKHLVQAMDGTIGVDSRPAAGSTFRIELKSA